MDNLVALFGMPRSGTTIIARLIANHRRVTAIVEPYQTGRDRDYGAIEIEKLCTDFRVAVREDSSLLVKETFTRERNIQLLQDLLEHSSQNFLRSAYILVLRSPIEAFLSQIEATEKYWAKAKNFTETEKSLKTFWTSFCSSMECCLQFALRFHRRVIVYDRFVHNPREEIGRAMGLFGYPLEQSQMDLSSPAPGFGGDPKARAAYSGIIPGDDRFRVEGVARITSRFGSVPEFSGMRSLHDYVKHIAVTQPPSETIMRDMALLIHRGAI
jgi:hypothetical protein